MASRDEPHFAKVVQLLNEALYGLVADVADRAFARPKLLVVGCKPIDPPPLTVTSVAELNALMGWDMSEEEFKRKYARPIAIHKLERKEP